MYVYWQRTNANIYKKLVQNHLVRNRKRRKGYRTSHFNCEKKIAKKPSKIVSRSLNSLNHHSYDTENEYVLKCKSFYTNHEEKSAQNCRMVVYSLFQISSMFSLDTTKLFEAEINMPNSNTILLD